MACKIKTLLQCKHCRHDLEVATVCGDRRVPLLWCPDCDILYQYFGPEEGSLIVQRALNMCALLRMNFWLKCHNYHQKPAEIFVQITVINNLNSTGIRANIQTT